MKLSIITLFAVILFSCAPDKPQNTEEYPDQAKGKSAVEDVINDPTKGIGAVKNVTLKTPLEQDRVERGLAIYEMKCSSCHRLDDKRVVGPGVEGSDQEPSTGVDHEHDHQRRYDVGKRSGSTKAVGTLFDENAKSKHVYR